MKKFKKFLASILVVALVVVVLGMPKLAKAEGVINFYFHNTVGWENVFCYIWQGSGPVEGTASWPGTQMQLVEGTEDWYHLEYTAGKAFQVIFNDNGSPKANQTGNLPADIEADQSDFWFVVGDTTTEQGTSDGFTASGLQVTVLTEAPEGFPGKEEAVAEDIKEDATSTTEVEATLDESPKMGDSIMPMVAIVSMIAAAGTVVVVASKKRKHME